MLFSHVIIVLAGSVHGGGDGVGRLVIVDGHHALGAEDLESLVVAVDGVSREVNQTEGL